MPEWNPSRGGSPPFLNGKMTAVIGRRSSGSSILFNNGQQSIGKTTSLKRPSYSKKTTGADDLIQLIERKVSVGKYIII